MARGGVGVAPFQLGHENSPLRRRNSSGAVSANYTPTLYLYNTAIAADQTNLAAAGAVILGLVIVVISTASLLFRRRRGEFR